jgi:hypothetical protein
MTDDACFCGWFFSFDGGAGACPKGGEVASVTGFAVPGGNTSQAMTAARGNEPYRHRRTSQARTVVARAQ